MASVRCRRSEFFENRLSGETIPLSSNNPRNMIRERIQAGVKRIYRLIITIQTSGASSGKRGPNGVPKSVMAFQALFRSFVVK